METKKIPWSTVKKRWPQQGVVQFREPTCQHLSYASNPGQIQKHLMEALKYLSSRARKRWIHQGRVQFQEPTHIHLNYASTRWKLVNSHISRDSSSGWWASTFIPKTILWATKCSIILVIFSVTFIFLEIFSKNLSGTPIWPLFCPYLRIHLASQIK